MTFVFVITFLPLLPYHIHHNHVWSDILNESVAVENLNPSLLTNDRKCCKNVADYLIFSKIRILSHQCLRLMCFDVIFDMFMEHIRPVEEMWFKNKIML